MRCTKCGYDGAGNVPGGTCEKCGTRLGTNEPTPIIGANRSSSYASDSRPTMIGMNVPADQNLKATRIVGAPEPKSPLKQTVIQGSVPGPGGQMKQTVVQNASSSPAATPLPNDFGELTCPKCGYPVAEHYTSCPNCGADFSGESEEGVAEEQVGKVKEAQAADATSTSNNKKTSKKKGKDNQAIQGTVGLGALKKEESDGGEEILCTCEKCGEEIPVTFRFCPKCGTEMRQRTLQGFRHKKRKEEVEEVPQPTLIMKFSLTIVPEDDESIEPVPNHFEGSEVMLNRKNTEPDNRTITSKEQAVVVNEGGKWYIENRSEYGSTLIFANRRMEIQSGDVIMLGDRRFKFESEEPEQK